jgi:hypothetical protein
VRLLTAQYGDRNIAVLNETAPLQSASRNAKVAAGVTETLRSIGFDLMSRRIAKETQRLAHLRLGFIGDSDIVRRSALPFFVAGA